jgi:hypothetical protein
VRQFLKYLLRALAHVARPREDKGHGTDRFGHETEADLVSGVSDALASVVRVSGERDLTILIITL